MRNEIKTTLFSVIFMYYKFCKMLKCILANQQIHDQQIQQNKHKYKIHYFVCSSILDNFCL